MRGALDASFQKVVKLLLGRHIGGGPYPRVGRSRRIAGNPADHHKVDIKGLRKQGYDPKSYSPFLEEQRLGRVGRSLNKLYLLAI